MKRAFVALVVVLLLGACSSSSNSLHNDNLVTPGRILNSTGPSPTLPTGVSQLCADAASALVREITGPLGGNVPPSLYSPQTFFYTLLAGSLSNCDSAANWLAATTAYAGGFGTLLDTVRASGCTAEKYYRGQAALAGSGGSGATGRSGGSGASGSSGDVAAALRALAAIAPACR
jgi:hypothetical protein